MTGQVAATPGARRGSADAQVAGWARPLGSVAALAAGCALLAVVDPREGGLYPPCPFYAITGRWCPACGTLRAANRALNGDLAGALAHNPLAVLAAPLVAYAFLRWALLTRPRGWRWPAPALGRWGSRSLVVAVAIFWVLRNLPGFAVLAPG